MFENELDAITSELKKQIQQEIHENGKQYLKTLLTQIRELTNEVNFIVIGDLGWETGYDVYLHHAAFKLQCYIKNLQAHETAEDKYTLKNLKEVYEYISFLQKAYTKMRIVVEAASSNGIDSTIESLIKECRTENLSK